MDCIHNVNILSYYILNGYDPMEACDVMGSTACMVNATAF